MLRVDTSVSAWGFLRVTVNPMGDRGGEYDVTYFRGVATQIGSYSYSDPFGDQQATITFPQITPLDDLGDGDLAWLQPWSNVTIWHVTAMEGDDVATPIWEGMIVSMESSISDSDSGLTVTCIGALYQVDFLLATPQTLTRQVYYEDLLRPYFDKAIHPSLRTSANLEVRFPDDWTIKDGLRSVSGIKTRQSGGWDKALTGYINESLTLMYTLDDRRWTISKELPRKPVMHLRDNETVKWTIMLGMPGVGATLNRDYSQTYNVVYGEGEAAAGTSWRNAVIDTYNDRTYYVPVAASNWVWPVQQTPTSSQEFDIPEVHTFMSFGGGYNQEDAISAGKRLLQRDIDPGWTGSITLGSDPDEGSRYGIRAGDNIRVIGLGGAGRDGVVLHIAQVTHTPGDATSLTVDSKFRDLFTLEQIIARNRDSRTPQRVLKVGVSSYQVEDHIAPWDVEQSGFVPQASSAAFKEVNSTGLVNIFPWTAMTTKYPPKTYPNYYVAVAAGENKRLERWSSTMVLASTNGEVVLTHFACVDRDGNLRKIPFHVGIYAVDPKNQDGYPRDDNGPSPFIKNAFHTMTGKILPDNMVDDYPPEKAKDGEMIIGWGDDDQYAGYTPGASHGPTGEFPWDAPTGILVDESSWSYDLESYEHPTGNDHQRALFVSFYAEHVPPNETVYFIGRFYRDMEDKTGEPPSA